ncbi:MAG: GNAT family N-acetyltransferase [FCB group bacterium]|jgi:predicted N-acetyltransferase YhbS|nr:GNAT family N-acetyltransferase [FCB group bacterium]
MEGPRSPHPDEYTSLACLVDTVFNPGHPGNMFKYFQPLFQVDNRDNLLVMSDGGEVVSHVGLTLRWAVLGGCTVRVASMGAVATCERYRGQGLASILFTASCEKARAAGADFMLISGERPLYLAAGATFVGRDHFVFADVETAETLALPGISVHPMQPEDLAACKALYDTKPARFVRPREDWDFFAVEPNVCGRPTEWSVVRRNGAICAYLLHGNASAPGVRRVIEWAGDATVVGAALKPILKATAATTLRLPVQHGDEPLRALLQAAGATFEKATPLGTTLLINFEQFMERMRPFFETRVGRQDAAGLTFKQDGDRFRIGLGGEQEIIEGKTRITRLILGHPDEEPQTGFLGKLFPLPELWYGLNYI